MTLGHIEKGSMLSVFEELEQSAVSDVYDAEFRYLENDTMFLVRCNWLYDNYDNLNPNGHLNLSIRIGPYVHTFTGRAREKQRGGMVLIEQLTQIETYNRRQFDRDELRVGVRIFGYPKEKIDGSSFEIPPEKPALADLTFDISSGGLCIITNNTITSKHDPYYLVEFGLSEKDLFLLPAELVRRSNYPRTRIGRYDYGFRFIFDNIPEESQRLTRAVITRKLSFR
jgi:hypothetical protein